MHCCVIYATLFNALFTQHYLVRYSHTAASLIQRALYCQRNQHICSCNPVKLQTFSIWSKFKGNMMCVMRCIGRERELQRRLPASTTRAPRRQTTEGNWIWRELRHSLLSVNGAKWIMVTDPPACILSTLMTEGRVLLPSPFSSTARERYTTGC